MTDLVVIGAGVVGLAIAREASQSGLETIVLEQKDRAGDDTCLLYTSPSPRD